MSNLNVANSQKYFSICSKDTVTNETVEYLGVGQSQYVLFEVNYSELYNDYIVGDNPNLVLELAVKAKLIYTTCEVYDVQSNTLIGTFNFDGQRMVHIPLDSIYNTFGRVQIKIMNTRSNVGFADAAIFADKVFVYYDAEQLVFNELTLNVEIDRTVFNEGEFLGRDNFSVSGYYLDGTSYPSIADYELSIERNLLSTDTEVSVTYDDVTVTKNITVIPVNNLGVRSYTRQLNGNIGNISYYINTNINQSNLIFSIPVIYTGGTNPLSYELIYNHQLRNHSMKCNFDYSLNELSVTNPAGTTDTFVQTEVQDSTSSSPTVVYKSSTSDFTLLKEINNTSQDYYLKDKAGNIYTWNNDYTYIKQINYKNGFVVKYKPEVGILISNQNGKIIRYYCNEFGDISSISYIQDNNEVLHTTFDYSEGKLCKMTTTQYDTIVENYCFEWDDNFIRIVDDKNGYAVKFYFNSNNIYRVEEDLYLADEASKSYIPHESRLLYDIKRDVNETIITNRNNDPLTIVFNNELEAYEYDKKGNVNIINYNSNKMIEYQSNLCNINLLKENGFTLLSGNNSSDLNVEEKELSIHASELGFTSNKKISGSGSVDYGYIDISGSKEDSLTLVTFVKQLTTYTSDCNSYLELSLYNESELVNTEKYDFNNIEIDSMNKFIVLGINANDCYTKARVQLYISGVSIEVSELVLSKADFGTFYKYDENNNLTLVRNSKTNLYKGYSNNYIDSEVTKGNQEKVYSYDSKMNPEKIVKMYNVAVNHEYDDKNRVIKTTTTSKVNGSVSNYYNYINDNLDSSYDNISNYNYYEYYADNRISNFTNNEENTTMIYTKDRLTGIVGIDDTSVNYALDLRGNITTLTVENGSVYTFNYDYKNRLTKVLLNNNILVEYSYDNDDNVTTKKYSNDEYYTFNYENDLLKSVNYVNSGICTYQYDEYDRLISITDLVEDLTTDYIYDEYNRVSKVSNDDVEFEYDYHVADNDFNVKSTIKEYTRYTGYNNITATNVSSANKLRGLFYDSNNMAGCMFINDCNLRRNYNDKTYIYPTTFSDKMLIVYNGIPCARVYNNIYCTDNDNIANYNYNQILVEGTSAQSKTMTISFWFNITNEFNKTLPISLKFPLFEKYTDDFKDKLYLDYYEGGLVLGLDSDCYYAENDVALDTSSSSRVKDGWNFVSLSYVSRYEDTNYRIRYTLKFNDDVFEGVMTTTKLLDFNESNSFELFKKESDHFNVSDCNVLVTGLMMSIDNKIQLYDVNDYYDTTKMYLINDPQFNLRTKAVDYNTAIEYNYVQDVDIYPLHGSLKSLTGKNASKVNVIKGNISDKAGLFNYNVKNRRYCFEANGNSLEYKLQNENNGGIYMMIYPYNSDKQRYIFDSYDNSNNSIKLYIDTNNELCLMFGTNTYRTEKYVTLDEWNFIGITYKNVGSTMYNVNVCLNNTFASNNYEAGCVFGQLITLIGSNKEKTNPLFGQIEMLIGSQNYIEYNNRVNLYNMAKTVSKTNEYDDLGRLVKYGVSSNGETIINNHVYYYGTDTKFTHRIKQEIIENNSNQLTIREYEVGSGKDVNRITGITDDVFGSKSYAYNDRGFLINDNGTSITYDINGNIKTYGTKTFSYDSTIKDRLISANGKSILYTTDNPLLPRAYDGKVFTYEGNRLTNIVEDYDNYTTIYHDYYYNSQGLRIKKNIGYSYTDDRDSEDYTTYYYYEGNKLITEYRSDNDRLDFLYDSNGMLYGFINNKTTRYYYVRDALQNILGIVDSQGDLVVKYSYNAFGETLSVTGSNSALGFRNPFRYKGYYYDVETGLFMVGHRYYNPEWGRWLSPDDVEYLEPDNINGLNLYCYCENDPVNKYDPDGHMPQWAQWLIGGAVIAGLGVATFFTGGAAGVILGAAFYGAVTGAVSSAVIGGTVGAITGGWEGFLDGAASGFMSGAIIGGATGALTAGLNYALGGVKIIGSAQKTGNLFHRFSSNVQAGKFAMQIGRYSEIGLNSKLKTVGLSGGCRPDVTAVARFGNNKLIEVVSKTQTVLSQQNKINAMIASNPGTTGRVISWALQHWFYF